MGDRQLHTNRLLGLDQMAHVGTAVMAASRTAAALVEGPGVLGVFFVAQVHLTMPGKQISVTGVAGGHDAIEEIHAHVNRLKNIAGRTDAHQVSRLVLGHIRLHHVDDAVHILRCLTDGQAADGVTVQVHLGDLFHVIDTQILIRRALIDTK